MTQPAGWYSQGEGVQRYWDGTRWTEHTAPLPVAAPVAPPPPVASSMVPYAAAAPGHPVAVAPKSPGLGVIASFFIPGLGSMINGEVGKGVAFLLCWLVAWGFTFILIGLPFLIGIEIWAMVDGYKGAQRWNARHGIVS